jgi:hypothetical protein
MSRHISVLFYLVKRDGVVLVGIAEFKKKPAKFLIESDLDLVTFFLGPPCGVMAA